MGASALQTAPIGHMLLLAASGLVQKWVDVTHVMFAVSHLNTLWCDSHLKENIGVRPLAVKKMWENVTPCFGNFKKMNCRKLFATPRAWHLSLLLLLSKTQVRIYLTLDLCEQAAVAACTKPRLILQPLLASPSFVFLAINAVIYRVVIFCI